MMPAMPRSTVPCAPGPDALSTLADRGVHGGQGSYGAMASETMTARITPSTIKVHITAALDHRSEPFYRGSLRNRMNFWRHSG